MLIKTFILGVEGELAEVRKHLQAADLYSDKLRDFMYEEEKKGK